MTTTANDSLSRTLSAAFCGHVPKIYKQKNQLGGHTLAADSVLKAALGTDDYGRIPPTAETFAL